MPENLMVSKTYETLQKAHALPSYEALDKEFEISEIEEKFLSLRSIRKKMVEKLEFFIKILEDIIHPDTNVTSMHESKTFTEQEKQRLFELYRNLMGLQRSSLKLSLDSTEQQEASYIKEVLSLWKGMRKELEFVIAVLQRCWKEDIDIPEDLAYLG